MGIARKWQMRRGEVKGFRERSSPSHGPQKVSLSAAYGPLPAPNRALQQAFRLIGPGGNATPPVIKKTAENPQRP